MKPGGLFTDASVVKQINERAVAIDIDDSVTGKDAWKLADKRTSVASNFLLIDNDGNLLFEGKGEVTVGLAPKRMLAILDDAWARFKGVQQDPKKDDGSAEATPDAPRPAPEHKQKLVAALRKTAALDDIAIDARVTRISPFPGGMNPFGSGPDGPFEAWITRDGVTSASIETEAGKLDVYRKVERVIQRHTWEGTSAPPVAGFARELKGILGFTDLAAAIESGDGVEADNPSLIGDVRCDGFRTTFDDSLIQDPATGMTVAAAIRLAVKQIVGTFYVNPETGLVVRISISIERKLPSQVTTMTNNPMVDEMLFRAKYVLELSKGDAAGRPKIPADVLRRLSR